jgi:glycosyltransferase involved in cell wall biosynthesis
VPVIGSDSGAIPGVIGDAGLIVPESDVNALVAALQRLSDIDLRQSLAKQGRERVMANFTHQAIAQATVDLYRSLLS